MILEAIYNGDFYPSETVVPKSEKYRNALRACEKIMDQLAQRLNKGGLRPGENAPGSVLHRPVRGKRVPLQGWLLGRTAGAAGGGKADPNKEL